MGEQVNETVADVIDDFEEFLNSLSSPHCNLLEFVARLRRAHGKEIEGQYRNNRDEALHQSREVAKQVDKIKVREALEEAACFVRSSKYGILIKSSEPYVVKPKETLEKIKEAISTLEIN